MIRILSNLLAIVAVAFIVAMVAGRGMGYTAHPILSGSMEPAMMTGSLAVVKNVPLVDIHKDDVIAFQPSDHSIGVSHRVKQITFEDAGGATLITKGDANNDVDPHPYVASGPELGKVFFSIPYLGYAVVFLGTKNGMILMAALVVLTLAAILWPKSTSTESISEVRSAQES